MESLIALRKRYLKSHSNPANSANPANSSFKFRQFRQFRHYLEIEEMEELQFLRDERAAIRQYDGGMSREQAEYFSLLDVPSLPKSIDEDG